ncbi:MAG TPA: DUF3579 domain-containing protein [Candidatus Thioglobus sp.]|jgi:hypothetical protein|nr:DUF3579 domain-containing protein [Candidatus Thioglobus sp.]HIB97134.1 DUF3579 domain-containing protein [Candidatus Thioglobus sp.]
MSHIRYTLSGITNDGQKFRPSDWTERLICMQPEQLKRYNGHLKIRKIDGIKSVVFDEQLEYACAFTYERIHSFAKINHLMISEEIVDNQEEA